MEYKICGDFKTRKSKLSCSQDLGTNSKTKNSDSFTKFLFVLSGSNLILVKVAW